MVLTPQSTLREWILLALEESPGGLGRRAHVLSAIRDKRAHLLTFEDKQSPETRPFETKWENRASYERAAMVREGLLMERSDGVWALQNDPSSAEIRVHVTDKPSSFSSGTEWLVASNPRVYDVTSAFKSEREIFWSETSARIAVGDVVYLYGSAPIRGLTHQCIVIATDLEPSDVVEDETFWLDSEALDNRQGRSWMRLRLLHAFDGVERVQLNYLALEKAGMNHAPQSRERVKPEVSQLISEILETPSASLSDDLSAEGADSDPSEVIDFRRRIADGDFSVADSYTTSKTRGSAQRAFSERVKRNYGNKCAITGVESRAFLVASHIVPWSADESIRLDPANGICLSTLVDRAFDTGYLSIDIDSTVVVDLARLTSDPALYAQLAPFNNTKLAKPVVDPPRKDYLSRRFEKLN